MRVANRRLVLAELSSLDEGGLAELISTATPLTTGIGGTTARLEVRGVPVFVKCLPLTDRERLPEHRMSTANVFDLPAFYHYGVGSTGFGAWREWASHRLANAWVIGGRCESFPLMYHCRELPVAPAPRVPPDDIDTAVRYWAGSPAVARRLHELAASTASLVLFLEFVPQTWSDWLVERFRQGGFAAESAVEMAATAWQEGIDEMRLQGMVHFDAHPRNILTDGRRLYFSDFGLALHSRFALSESEREFLDRHRSFDRYDVVKYLVNSLVHALCPAEDRDTVIRAAAVGDLPDGWFPRSAARFLRTHAAVADLMNGFYAAIVDGPKTTPYPAAALAEAWRRGGGVTS
ncbi:serine/threonine protein phosphatase [Micromonospora sp. URMC 103]|uniref:serine/threonine protein phosphatase n=1 Tax=Micromonospora sp. URMC 103 TaxID=3423406 RepID=UPI003F1D89A0